MPHRDPFTGQLTDVDLPSPATHWVGCWRVHLDCAVAIIERLIDGAIDEAAMRLIDGSGVG